MTRAVRQLAEELTAQLEELVAVARVDARHGLLEEMRAFTAAHPVRARRRRKVRRDVKPAKVKRLTMKSLRAQNKRAAKAASKVAEKILAPLQLSRRLARAGAEDHARGARLAKVATAAAGPARKGSPAYKARVAQAMRDSWVRRRAQAGATPAAAKLAEHHDYGGGPGDLATNPVDHEEEAKRLAARVDPFVAAAQRLVALPTAQALELAAQLDARAEEFRAHPVVVRVENSPPRVALAITRAGSGFVKVRLAAGKGGRYSQKVHKLMDTEVLRAASAREAELGYVVDPVPPPRNRRVVED